MSRNVVRVLLLVALFSFAHIAVAQCPFNDPVMQTIETPILSTVPIGPGGQVSGKVNEKSGFGKKIEFCVLRSGAPVAVIGPVQVDWRGNFVAAPAALESGDEVTARLMDMTGGAPIYGPTSKSIKISTVCVPSLPTPRNSLS